MSPTMQKLIPLLTITATLAAAEPARVKVLDASGTVERVQSAIWQAVVPLLALDAGPHRG